MNFFRPSSDSYHPSESGKPLPISFSEAVLDTSSFDRIRATLSEEHRTHLDELRKNIFAFCKEFEIPVAALSNKETFGTYLASPKIPPQRMQEAVLLFQRFEYLIVHKEPLRETPPEYLEEAERLYNLTEQYTAQVDLLKQMGVLHPRREQLSGRAQRLADFFQSLLPFSKKKRTEQKETKEVLCITGIDGKEYPLPTLGEIATHLCEQRELFATKRDQGFTKLLLVPFGMSLDALQEILKYFLFSYEQVHPTFGLNSLCSLRMNEEFLGADIGDPPNLIYHPTIFDRDHHQGKTKLQILKEQTTNPSSFPGWKVHLLQPSDPGNPDSLGFPFIPLRGKGQIYGEEKSRPDIEDGKSADEYILLIQQSQDNPDSPYFHESGLTPEDWFFMFITHLIQTGEPLDDYKNEDRPECISYLTGTFFLNGGVPGAYWNNEGQAVGVYRCNSIGRNGGFGIRTSVIV